MRELNSRQWDLYNLLKNNPDKYFTQIEIAEALPAHYPPDSTNQSFHDSAARLLITADIRAINKSDIIQKIIISTRRGVKIASKEEFERYINGQYAAIFRKLERTRQKANKANLDGQMRFVINSERDIIEAYSNGINRIKAARLAAGLRLADVAAQLRASGENIDVAMLSKFETGKCLPTLQTLDKLAHICAVSAETLAGCELYHHTDKTPQTPFANAENSDI